MRLWSLPSRPRIEQSDHTHDPSPENLFWYCRSCGIRYAEIRHPSHPSATWQGKVGGCSSCAPTAYTLPGSIGWWNYSLGLPKEVWEYELECEIRFLDSPYSLRKEEI